MGMMLLQNFSELGLEGLQELYIRGVKSIPKYYKRLYNVMGSDSSSETDYQIAGFGAIPVKTEGIDMTTITINKNGKKTYTQAVRASQMQISYEVKRFGHYNVVKQLTTEFAASFVKTMDYVAHLPFNNLTSAIAPYVGVDGVSIANTLHQMANGVTQANCPAVAATMSRANVETEINRIATWVNDGGLPMLAVPYALYCHSARAMKAKEILKSTSRPDWQAGANAMNTLPELEIIATPYLNDPEDWGILCNPPEQRKIKMFVADYPKELRLSSVSGNYDEYYSSLLTMVCGFSDWTDIDCGHF